MAIPVKRATVENINNVQTIYPYIDFGDPSTCGQTVRFGFCLEMWYII